MDSAKDMNIRLVVDDEESLYTKYSPDNEFDEAVKGYIRAKALTKGEHQSISLTVISKEPIDEDRFRAAVSDWIADERAVFQKIQRDTIRMMIGMLVLGSVMVILSLVLEQHFEVLKHSLIPIFGALALSKAAESMIITLPVNNANKRLLNEMGEHRRINFEYGLKTDDSPQS